MVNTTIPFAATGHFSKLISDYLSNTDFLKPYAAFALELDAFEKAIAQRKSHNVNRKVLVDELNAQYKTTVFASELVDGDLCLKNIQSLNDENTFTVTTGHQLSIFTGPLYFVYKILSVIKLTETLKQKYPHYNFVPVYWMATEDHDFDEIKSVSLSGKSFTWQTEQHGAVGRFNTNGFKKTVDEVCSALYKSTDTPQLIAALQTAYLKNETLAAATRSFVHALFSKYGLVIVDADSNKLKQSVIPLFSDELSKEFSFNTHNETTKEFAGKYDLQVHPREINLFYLKDGIRERIIKEGAKYTVHNTDITFTEKEIIEELNKHPERFSPNVILRPLYQETILPNLAYIGGPAEVHYWLQLKAVFDKAKVFYPMVVLRNCLLMMDERSGNTWKKTELDLPKLFLPVDSLITDYIKVHFSHEIKMDDMMKEAAVLYNKIKEKAIAVDVTLKAHAEAEQVKFLKRIKATENKITRALKRREEVQVKRIESVKSQLFPGDGLQERKENILPYLSQFGFGLLDELKDAMQPLAKEFIVITN